MGHYVSGFVGKWDQVGSPESLPEGAVVASLEGGFGLLLTEEEAYYLPKSLDEAVAKCGLELSRTHGAVALVGTEYFGGVGCQAAAVWHRGNVVMPYEIAEDGVINRALGKIGVRRDGPMGTLRRFFGISDPNGSDLFDFIGLGRHRNNKAWIASASHGRQAKPI